MGRLISVDHLVKTFPVPGTRKSVWAVNDVSFQIEPGETLALVGESGSGKTTVGRCLVRLVDPTAGRVDFLGQDLSTLSGRELRRTRAKIRIVFQDPFESLNPRATIEYALHEPLRAMGVDEGERKVKVSKLMDQTGIDPRQLQKYPHELSGGQLQAIGVARAMATDPVFIVLDEPTSLLDPSVRGDTIALLMQLQRDTGVSYLFISHDLTTARHISQKVAVMYLGKIVETAATEEIFQNPAHPYTKALLSSVLYPDPRHQMRVIPLPGEIPSPIDLPSGCFLHSRCPIAIPSCRVLDPELVARTPNHMVACIRTAPLPHQIVEPGQVVGDLEAAILGAPSLAT